MYDITQKMENETLLRTENGIHALLRTEAGKWDITQDISCKVRQYSGHNIVGEILLRTAVVK